MTSKLLLPKIHVPRRTLHSDVEWSDLLDEFLTDNFSQREMEGGSTLVGLDWNHCVEYKFQVRKETPRLILELNFSIQQALWLPYGNLPLPSLLTVSFKSIGLLFLRLYT